jgi:hypothetical protein
MAGSSSTYMKYPQAENLLQSQARNEVLPVPMARLRPSGSNHVISFSNLALIWNACWCARSQRTGKMSPTPTTGIDANGIPGFEILRVRAGISNPAGTCVWYGSLTDELCKFIDLAQGRETFPTGDNTIVLDFNGYKIARFGADGRYRLADVVVTCGADEITSPGLFLTQPFQATQFEYAIADFVLIPSPAAATINQGGTVRYRYALTPPGRFFRPREGRCFRPASKRDRHPLNPILDRRRLDRPNHRNRKQYASRNLHGERHRNQWQSHAFVSRIDHGEWPKLTRG